jgi:ABC-2 type transport system permease protein
MFKLTILYYRSLLKPGITRYALMALVVVVMLGSIGTQAFGMGMLGGAAAVPPLFFLAATFLTLITAITSSSKQLFGFRDLDTQLSWPFAARTIVASRVLIFYVSELAFAAMLLLPAYAAYAWFLRPEWWFYPTALILLLVTPVIPCIAGAILGSVLAFVTAKFRLGKALEYIGLIVIFAAVMVFSFASGQMTGSAIAGSPVFGFVEKLRSTPIELFNNALNGNVYNLCLLTGVSVVLFAAFAFILGRVFFKVNSAITSKRTRSDYKLKVSKQSGAFAALISKEFKIYFASPLYVFNTILLVIFAALIGGAAGVLGFDKILSLLGVTPEILDEYGITTDQIAFFIPFMLAYLAALSPTTSCTISIEGRRLESLVALPISESRIYIVKLAVNFILYLPLMILVGLFLALRIPSLYSLYYVALPAAYIILSAVLGLGINLVLPKLNWTSESQAVKQSAAVFATTFINMALFAVPLILLFAFNIENWSALLLATTFGALALAAIIWGIICAYKGRLRELL